MIILCYGMAFSMTRRKRDAEFVFEPMDAAFPSYVTYDDGNNYMVEKRGDSSLLWEVMEKFLPVMNI